MGEAINLIENFKVEKVIFNCGEYNDLEKELIKVLDKKKIKYYSCIKELNINDNKLYFLNTKEYDNENDNSNVIYTELNGYKFMFMRDVVRISKGTTKQDEQFDFYANNLENLHRYNLHKYMGCSPAIHFDLWDSSVKNGWEGYYDRFKKIMDK